MRRYTISSLNPKKALHYLQLNRRISYTSTTDNAVKLFGSVRVKCGISKKYLFFQ